MRLNEEIGRIRKVMGVINEEIQIERLDGFIEVFIMSDGEAVGDMTLETPDEKHYMVVMATIKEEFKGRGLYKKAMLELLDKMPNIIIQSAFRSDEAERAWKSLIKQLPPDVGYKIEKIHTVEMISIFKKNTEITETIMESITTKEGIKQQILRKLSVLTDYVDERLESDVFFNDLVQEIRSNPFDNLVYFDSERFILDLTDDITNEYYSSFYPIIGDEDEDESMVYDTMYVNISEIVEVIIRSLYTEKIDNFINRVNEML